MQRLQRANRFAEGTAPSYLRAHPITYERIAEAQRFNSRLLAERNEKIAALMEQGKTREELEADAKELASQHEGSLTGLGAVQSTD